MKKRMVLIGPGRAGQSVARLLHEAGHEFKAVISRDPVRAATAARFIGAPGAGTTDLSRARAGEIVLIAIPDDHIEEMAATLRREGYLAPGAILIHFSGILPAAIMQDEEGSPRALSIHPLQTFADAVIGVHTLPGSPFAVEGDEALLPLAEKLVSDMGGTPFRIASIRKPLYHAAACVASNYLVTIIVAARQIMSACGFSDEEAFHLLAPLLRGTGKNLAALGPEQALTGPIARGDVKTVAAHLQALTELDPELQEIYRVLGRKTVEVARKKGTLDQEKAEEILRILKGGELGAGG
jgi:predicted short-subunit dehydrogenase-like oxidoreductase (DUF2520 family)